MHFDALQNFRRSCWPFKIANKKVVDPTIFESITEASPLQCLTAA
jgi:hypothetical protein